MVGLRAVIIVAVLMALILGIVAEKNKRLHARHAHHNQMRCTNNPDWYPYLPPCQTTPSEEYSGDETSTTSTTTIIPTTTPTTTTQDPTSLERAHWCRFNNGSYVPLGYVFMNSVCSMCQCTQSRSIRCQTLQCMPTYCIDNSMPYRKSGQCCTQCAYEVSKGSCVYNNISFPHGTVLKAIRDKMQCWCQLGNIECRNYMGTPFDGLDIFADNSAIFIVVIVILAVLIFGVLLCCGIMGLFYFYYKRHEHTFQQAYDEYINAAGWQPMEEEEQYVVDGAEEKQREAEQYQYENPSNDFAPPPYVVPNDSPFSVDEQKQKQ